MNNELDVSLFLLSNGSCSVNLCTHLTSLKLISHIAFSFRCTIAGRLNWLGFLCQKFHKTDGEVDLEEVSLCPTFVSGPFSLPPLHFGSCRERSQESPSKEMICAKCGQKRTCDTRRRKEKKKERKRCTSHRCQDALTCGKCYF